MVCLNLPLPGNKGSTHRGPVRPNVESSLLRARKTLEHVNPDYLEESEFPEWYKMIRVEPRSKHRTQRTKCKTAGRWDGGLWPSDDAYNCMQVGLGCVES